MHHLGTRPEDRAAWELDEVIFESYLRGLRAFGWRIDRRTRDLVRFGYALHTPLNMGLFAGGALAASAG